MVKQRRLCVEEIPRMTEQRDIILLSFPFTDLKSAKIRPAIILSNNKYNKTSQDIIAVPITSNLKTNQFDILIKNKDLEKGELIVDSKIKTDKIFSVEKKIVRKNIGKINRQAFTKLKANISEIIR